MGWDDFLTENPTFFCFHNKKDTFSHFGKTLTERRFVLRWHNSPPFRRSANTRNFSINSKSIKNEQTTTTNQIERLNRLRRKSDKLLGI